VLANMVNNSPALTSNSPTAKNGISADFSVDSALLTSVLQEITASTITKMHTIFAIT